MGLKVSLASYGLLEHLLLKAGVFCGDNPVGSRRSIGRSPFPSVAASSWGNSVALRTNYSLSTVTKSDASIVVAVEGSLQEPFSSEQADARLAAAHASSGKPGSDSLKALQEIESSEKKKQSKMWKWSKEGRQKPLLPAGGDRRGSVFTKKILELAPFAKVFATGSGDSRSNRYCFYSMLCKRNMLMKTRSLYELKRHFRADQGLRDEIC